MNWFNFTALLLVVAAIGIPSDNTARSAEPLSVLILDGHNPYHDWQVTTPVLQHLLRRSGRFTVEVATAPPEGQDLSGFCPPFADFDVVLSNYNSQQCGKAFKVEFLKYLQDGGGFVCVHAADNAFADWPEYNRVCGIGGWYGRDHRWGPYVYFRDGQLVRDDTSRGKTGHHGNQHEYQVQMRDLKHPITRGLPAYWLHARDEIYEQLRGPAENMHVLASAYADPETGGSGRHEPTIMVLSYGEGRVFHTTLGHADYSMRCIGFTTTLLRGTEWAATGEVTIPVPENFPTKEASSSWE